MRCYLKFQSNRDGVNRWAEVLAISAFMSKNSVSKVCSDCHVSLYSEQQILVKCFESPVFPSQAVSDFMQPNSKLRVAVGSGMVCLYSPVLNPHLRLFLKNLQVQFSVCFLKM